MGNLTGTKASGSRFPKGRKVRGECCSKGTFIKAAKKILEERHLRGQISGPIKAKPALINTKNFAQWASEL